MGSDYGGWSFQENKNLENKFIISAGLGEDASFDIELINKYNCKVIIVDPTPRAIDHYNQIIKNSGAPKKDSYKEGGKQIISSYDLTNINNKNLILIKKGLYNSDNEELKFFAPPNKSHVSHSIIDWQNDIKILKLCQNERKVKSIFIFTINDLKKAKKAFLMGANVVLSDSLK